MKRFLTILSICTAALAGHAQSALDCAPVEYFHLTMEDYGYLHGITPWVKGATKPDGTHFLFQIYDSDVCGIYFKHPNSISDWTYEMTLKGTNINDQEPLDGKTYRMAAIGNDWVIVEGLTAPPNQEFLSLPEGIELILWGCFKWNSFKEIQLPSSLQEIDVYAFANSTNLENFTTPSSLRHLNYGAFANSPNLSKVTIEDSHAPLRINGGFYADPAEQLDMLAWPPVDSPFLGCPLEYIYVGRDITDAPDERDLTPGRTYGYWIPYSVERFKGLFEGQARLETIELGPLVTALPTKFFWGCTGLKEVVCRAVVPPTMDDTVGFDNPDQCDLSEVTLVVPTEALEAYRTAPGWRRFTRISAQSGIEAVNAAENLQPVEYYNLQGQRISRLTLGQVLLRRQGTQVTKEIAR